MKERFAIKGPGFRLRHRLRAIYAYDGVPIGHRRVVDRRQHRASWLRLNIMDKNQALAMLTKDLIAYDRELVRGAQA